MENTQTIKMTSEQVEFFNTWKSIIKGHYRGNGYSVEWNYDLNAIQIQRPGPQNNLGIDITMIDKTMGGGVSIDLVDLDKTDIFNDDWAEYYIAGYEFDNTAKSTLSSVEYLFDLIDEL